MKCKGRTIRRIAPTKSLNSAVALNVRNLNHLKIALLSHTVLCCRDAGSNRDPRTCGPRGTVHYLELPLPPFVILSRHKGPCFPIPFRNSLKGSCRGNRSFHLLLWKYDGHNIFESLRGAFYMIILLFLIIKVICAHCQNLVKYKKCTKIKTYIPDRISHFPIWVYFLPYFLGIYLCSV